jgi:hypothetical protein
LAHVEKSTLTPVTGKQHNVEVTMPILGVLDGSRRGKSTDALYIAPMSPWDGKRFDRETVARLRDVLCVGLREKRFSDEQIAQVLKDRLTAEAVRKRIERLERALGEQGFTYRSLVNPDDAGPGDVP